MKFIGKLLTICCIALVAGGKRVQGLAETSKNANPGEFRYYVKISVGSVIMTQGVFISPKHVLTQAYELIRIHEKSPADLQHLVTIVDLPEFTSPTAYPLKRISICDTEDCRKMEDREKLGVLTLLESVPMSKPLKLPNLFYESKLKLDSSTSELKVISVGKDMRSYDKKLRWDHVRKLSDKVCERSLHQLVSNKELCIIGSSNSYFSLTDAGAPLVDGEDTLIGIVQVIDNRFILMKTNIRELRGLPAVVTRVVPFHDYINEEMNLPSDLSVNKFGEILYLRPDGLL